MCASPHNSKTTAKLQAKQGGMQASKQVSKSEQAITNTANNKNKTTSPFSLFVCSQRFCCACFKCCRCPACQCRVSTLALRSLFSLFVIVAYAGCAAHRMGGVAVGVFVVRI